MTTVFQQRESNGLKASCHNPEGLLKRMDNTRQQGAGIKTNHSRVVCDSRCAPKPSVFTGPGLYPERVTAHLWDHYRQRKEVRYWCQPGISIRPRTARQTLSSRVSCVQFVCFGFLFFVFFWKLFTSVELVIHWGKVQSSKNKCPQLLKRCKPGKIRAKNIRWTPRGKFSRP